MTLCALIQRFGLTCVFLSAGSLSGCDGGAQSGGGAGGGGANVSESGAKDSALSANDRAATEFVQRKIDEHWVKVADGWTTQLPKRNVFGETMEGVPEILFLQYREMNFAVRSYPVSEAQKLNGTTYRAEISFRYTPARQYRAIENMDGPPGWSPWHDDTPASSIAVELRNGNWLITDAEMFVGKKPDPASIPASK
jgi:hypothetical protein